MLYCIKLILTKSYVILLLLILLILLIVTFIKSEFKPECYSSKCFISL